MTYALILLPQGPSNSSETCQTQDLRLDSMNTIAILWGISALKFCFIRRFSTPSYLYVGLPMFRVSIWFNFWTMLEREG